MEALGSTNQPKTTYAPSRKWWVATVTGLGTVGIAWAQAGEWTTTLTVSLIGFVVQRAVSWLIPNEGKVE